MGQAQKESIIKFEKGSHINESVLSKPFVYDSNSQLNNNRNDINIYADIPQTLDRPNQSSLRIPVFGMVESRLLGAKYT